MKKQYLDALPLAFAFVLLWVPMGQHAFLFAHWMKLGTFMAPFLVLVALATREDTPNQPDLQTLSVLMLVAYIVHQFEEHWIDLYGTHYAFYPYVNQLLQGVVGAPETKEILSPAAIFVINTALVWLVGSLAILLSRRTVFPFLCMAAIILVNAISHIAAAIATMSYNPGLATSVLVFLPVAWIAFRSAKEASSTEKIASIVWAFAAHIVMIGGVLGANALGLYAEGDYFVMLVIMSLIPAMPLTAGRSQTKCPGLEV
ncbi:MAG: HXXEE domain-containing protein [Pseudomonadota bacterium]